MRIKKKISWLLAAALFPGLSAAQDTTGFYARYPLILKAKVEQVFLYGGMGGWRRYQVVEVAKGRFTENMFIMAISLMEYPPDAHSLVWIYADTAYTNEDIVIGLPVTSYQPGTDSAPLRMTLRRLQGLQFPIGTRPEEHPDFTKIRPVDFLDYLRNPALHSMIIESREIPPGWIRESDLPLLAEFLDSGAFAIPVYTDYNADSQILSSTIGIEALFMLEGFRAGHYPPGHCSLGYRDDQGHWISDTVRRKSAIREWLNSRK